MKHSDKTFMGMTTSPKNAEDVMEMCAILFGAEFMETHPVVTGNCNGNSPLVWDETMLGAMRAFCRAQPAGAVLALRAGRRQYAGLASPPPWRSSTPRRCRALAYTQVIRTRLPGDLRPLPVAPCR